MRNASLCGSRGLKRRPMLQGLHILPFLTQPNNEIVSLTSRDRLRLAGGQAFPAVGRNGSVDDGAAIDAFPCVKNQKEIGEPL